MNASLIAIGSEMLRIGRRDTNGDWLTERLNRLGVEVRARTVVEDEKEAVVLAIRTARATAELVVLTGGLGPTDDDRTRGALAAALDRPLERDPREVERLRGWFEDRGRTYRDVQSVQADRPEGATWIANPIGTAPGILVELDDGLVAALPGVPVEMRTMFDEALAPWIRRRSTGTLVGRALKIGGLPESAVEARVNDLYGSPGTDVTILSGGEGIELHIRVRDADGATARARLAELETGFRERLGADVYGADEDTLSAVVGAELSRRGLTIATAESCTAGLLGAALTATAGSSAWFRGGLVVYSDDLKISLAGVEPEVIRTHGAVSERVAAALAQGARRRCGADLGVGITGIAGPGGGTADKPVGLVHVALADHHGLLHREVRMVGDRGLVRTRTVSYTLDLIRRHLGKATGSA